jgi:ABC-type Fe3+-hydroxamate transport system substrate-binding protein
MEKINKILGKYGIIMLLVFSILTFFNTCGTKSAIKTTNKRIDAVEQRDSLNIEIQAIEDEIISLETSKRTLYDWNKVVRTTERPDDLMNQYDNKIKELRKKLESVKNGK